MKMETDSNNDLCKDRADNSAIITVNDNSNKISDSEEHRQIVTWKDLGLIPELCNACEQLKWHTPTRIQQQSIPLALEKRDIIGLAETGSGKTAAFTLPILQNIFLLEKKDPYFAVILTPTRELAYQILEQINALTANLSRIRAIAVVGGMDMVQQTINIALKPQIIVATPGRLVHHLETIKGFVLSSLKYLIMDEADRILNLDFEVEVNKILKVIPRQRCTMLFSATMTKKVKKLQRASLRNPVRVEVSDKYQTVDTLQQYHILLPFHLKNEYLVHVLNTLSGNSFLIFCATCSTTILTALILRNLGFTAIPLHGKMSQSKRLDVLNKFKAKSRSILICTDVLSRGLDIPHVDCVINYDIPDNKKDYIHRVGRTARAGRSGVAVTFVTQFEIDSLENIEKFINKTLTPFKINLDDIESLKNQVEDARHEANKQERSLIKKNPRRTKDHDDDDAEGSLGVRKRLKITNDSK